ncbi:MAG: site-specific integrase [Treponema sp.]|jgi:site-specific recombinase XerD|nr:site-specific integrase [Treponema sp.]
MDVVYLFYETDQYAHTRMRIPFYDYDKPLFMRLVKNGGYWDAPRRQFFLPHLQNSALNHIFTGVYVTVKESSGLASAHGFFETPCPQETAAPAASGNTAPDNASITSKENFFSDKWRKKLNEALHLKKYSPKTRKMYLHYNTEFCGAAQKPPPAVTSDDVRRYIASLDEKLKRSAATMNLAISALKFFYNEIMHNPIVREHSRPRQDKRLPLVLSKKEIQSLLSAETNPKHKLLLMLCYSCGLRVSEAVALKIEDIDFTRRTALIRMGKGRRDRYTVLGETAASYLSHYRTFFPIDLWIFPGQNAGEHLSVRSAERIFEQALRNVGIEKKASIHSLRHSFATHLLESGVDIRYIKDLLGHASIRTTERYTHVARRHALKIPSPLDIDVD